MGGKSIGLAAAGAALATAGAEFAVMRRPKMSSDAGDYAIPCPVGEDADGELRAVFLGVSTIALTDGETTIMTDGFFSRPPMTQVLGRRIRSNSARIDAALRVSGVVDVAALFVAHSHYDHALDSPAVAWRTGAKMVGSESTMNIGRGWGLAEDKMCLPNLDEPMRFGNFRVQVILSEHSPHPKFTGFITDPVVAPARVGAYKMAECYSFHITHASESGKVRRLVIHPSAGFIPGMFDDFGADVIFLGAGPLGKQSEQFRADYWQATVGTLGSQRVYPIHWDDFTHPLGRELIAMPYFADNFNVTLKMLKRHKEVDGVEYAIPEPFVTIDPFANLSAPS
ncbi:MAG: MBL fold metallo-hydrolase [Actinobacteria bacterium]|nr:MBL fold metallo-hydrolase [Actinomycetota bacterium]